MRITLTFTPQRVVNGALVASALGALLCLLLIAFSWRGSARSGVPRHKNGSVAASAPEPIWSSPWKPIGARPRSVAVLGATLGVGLLAALVDQPVVGAGIAVVTLLSLLVPRGPRLLAAAGVVSLGGAAAFTIAKQWRNSYPPDFGWAGFFSPAHDLALAALLLMLASVAAGATRRRAARRAQRR
jgi:hypothetical protein